MDIEWTVLNSCTLRYKQIHMSDTCIRYDKRNVTLNDQLKITV